MNVLLRLRRVPLKEHKSVPCGCHSFLGRQWEKAKATHSLSLSSPSPGGHLDGGRGKRPVHKSTAAIHQQCWAAIKENADGAFCLLKPCIKTGLFLLIQVQFGWFFVYCIYIYIHIFFTKIRWWEKGRELGRWRTRTQEKNSDISDIFVSFQIRRDYFAGKQYRGKKKTRKKRPMLAPDASQWKPSVWAIIEEEGKVAFISLSSFSWIAASGSSPSSSSFAEHHSENWAVHQDLWAVTKATATLFFSPFLFFASQAPLEICSLGRENPWKHSVQYNSTGIGM